MKHPCEDGKAARRQKKTKTKIVIVMVKMIINKSFSVLCSASRAGGAA